MSFIAKPLTSKVIFMVYYHIDFFYTIWYVYYCVEFMYIMSSMLVFACKKKNYLLCSIENFFQVLYRPMCEKNVKADKNQNTIFFNSYLCKFSICSNPRNVVFIKMWLHWISGCWNKSKTSKVTYCRYKYLYTCYQLVGIVKGWLQGFFFKLSYNVWSLFFGCCLRKMS